jgi:MFS family permease
MSFTAATRATSFPSSTQPAPDAYSSNRGRQTWLIVVLTLVATLGAIDRQIMSLLLVPIKADLHLTDTSISLLYGLAYSLANVLFLLPAGYFADRVNRRNLLLIGIAVWSCLTVSCGFATSYLAMFFARAGVGFGESVIQPTGVSMLRSAIPPVYRGRAFAVYATAIMLGSALALLVGGWLIHLLQTGYFASFPILGNLKPWQAVLALLGLVGVPALLVTTTVREPPRQTVDPRAVNASYREALRFIQRNARVFYPLLVFNTAAGMVSLAFGAWVAPVLLRVWHLTLPQVGVTLGLMMLIGPPIGLAIVGTLMDRYSLRYGIRGPLMVGAGAIAVITLVTTCAPIAPTLPIFWGILAAVMLMSGATFPITSTVMAGIAPPHILGRLTGIQYILYGIFGGATAATLVATVSDHFFTGDRAIAHALSLMSACYGLISLSAVLICLRNMKTWARESTARYWLN